MTKLTDSQLIVLSAAAARDDGLAVVPAKMAKAAAAKVSASLVARKLMREVRGKPGQPAWTQDSDGRALCLIITAAGRKMIGVEEGLHVTSPTPIEAAKRQASDQSGMHGKCNAIVGKTASKNESQADGRTRSAETSAPALGTTTAAQESPPLTAPRENTKQALVLAMLSAKAGTTLDALIKATGWLPHTTRAALTGLRKRGHLIERSKAEGETSVYRIGTPEATAAPNIRGKADVQATA